MKKHSIMAAVIWSSIALVGMSAQAPSEPEFPDVFYALDSGRLVKLERQEIATRVKLSSPISAKGGLEIEGSKSPVRFQAGHALEFIVRSSANADPESLYHLRTLESKKRSREATLVKASILGAKVSNKGLLPMEFAKYGESSLKITITSLDPGEYALGRQGGRTVFCFGID